jgi:hypothetical protein
MISCTSSSSRLKLKQKDCCKLKVEQFLVPAAVADLSCQVRFRQVAVLALFFLLLSASRSDTGEIVSVIIDFENRIIWKSKIYVFARFEKSNINSAALAGTGKN